MKIYSLDKDHTIMINDDGSSAIAKYESGDILYKRIELSPEATNRLFLALKYKDR